MPVEALSAAEIQSRIRSVATWYHVIELGCGIETPGVYDMRPTIPKLGLPDLRGEAVLDVGASDGFFSFHFERNGAGRVVAADLSAILDHDYPQWWRDRFRSSQSETEIRYRNHQWLHAGFEVARGILGSRVEKVESRVYDLPDRVREKFDLVFCSNVLLHLRDPVLAIEAMRRMLRDDGKLILVSPADLSHESSYARFIGSADAVEWWIPSLSALVKMAQAAGFGRAEVTSTFQMSPVNAPERAGPMAVLHCEVPNP